MIDLIKIEKELKVKLPDFFVKFHLEKNNLIKELINDSFELILYSDSDIIITTNKNLFKIPTDKGMFRNKICIGEDGCGNYSFISTINNDKRVFFLDHDIAGELFNEEKYELDWENEKLQKHKSIGDYLKYHI
ncbi:SMI1/KNR4 family protein [Algibacter lectus]|uniref:SMI1/KNR4 family protein n=1 Tax=Algibacter lectus TaxID=221126 RepID=UPI0005A9F1ED|nr:SMI1/KNR4 family protein [Algibacter lectus]